MDNILEELDKDRRGMKMINFKLKIAEKLEGIVNIDKKELETYIEIPKVIRMETILFHVLISKRIKKSTTYNCK